WALKSYQTFEELSSDRDSGVSMLQLRTFSRTGTVSIPDWATSLGASRMNRTVNGGGATTPGVSRPTMFASGFTIVVPRIDTTIYLSYLAARFQKAGGKFAPANHLEDL